MAIVIFLSFVEFLERDERVHSMYDRLCVVCSIGVAIMKIGAEN